jgi:predicted amidophosphoribosyltransferase
MWRRIFPLTCPSCSRLCAERCEVCWDSFGPARHEPPPPGLATLQCAFAYEGRVRNLVLGAKATPAHGWLNVMADALPPGRPVTLVTWPTGSAEHRRRRGYDPAERLARRYARRHRLVAADLLIRHGVAQEGRTAVGRSSLRFVARRPLAGLSVLVIDDVVTTGATMRAAASALLEAGAANVDGLAFARKH